LNLDNLDKGVFRDKRSSLLHRNSFICLGPGWTFDSFIWGGGKGKFFAPFFSFSLKKNGVEVDLTVTFKKVFSSIKISSQSPIKTF
jgi:hypothetical protein